MVARDLVRRTLSNRLVGNGGLLVSLGAAGATALLLSVYVPRQFDLHHTGLIATKLVAFGEGLRMHAEVYSQYGPLLTWSQSILLPLGATPVLTLHIWTVSITVATVFLLADLGRVAPPKWKVRQRVTVWAAILWVGLDPTWTQGYLFPWSSLLADMLLALALYTFAIGYNNQITQSHPKIQAAAWVSTGLAVGVTPFGRINVGLAAILVLVVCIITIRWFGNSGGARQAKLLSSGLAGGLIIPLLFLAATRGLRDYWEQSIVGPLEWAESALSPSYWNTWVGLAEKLEILGNRILPIFFLIVLATTASAYFMKRNMMGASRALALGASGATLLLSLYLSGALEFALRYRSDPELGALGNFREVEPSPYDNIMYFLMFVFLSLGLLKLISMAGRAYHQGFRVTTAQVFDLMVWGLGLALIVQVVPTYDTRHVWWGIPLALVCILVTVDRHVVLAPSRHLVAGALFISLLPSLVLGAHGQLSAVLVQANPSSMGAGQWVEPDVAVEINIQLEIAREISHSPAVDPVYFMVRDGSVAAIDGTFRSDRSVFVWWASSPSIEEIRREPWETLVIDSWVAGFLGYDEVSALADPLGATASFCTGNTERTTYCIFDRTD